MNYVTVSMLIAHTGEHRDGVMRCLNRAGVQLVGRLGSAGYQISECDANRALGLAWPEMEPIRVEALRQKRWRTRDWQSK